MNVSFKSTYAVSGDNILHTPITDVGKFFEATKSLRKKGSVSSLNKDTFEYYVDIKDEKEPLFEQMAQKHKIKVKKVNSRNNDVPVAGSQAHIKAEMESMFDLLIECIDSKRCSI